MADQTPIRVRGARVLATAIARVGGRDCPAADVVRDAVRLERAIAALASPNASTYAAAIGAALKTLAASPAQQSKANQVKNIDSADGDAAESAAPAEPFKSAELNAAITNSLAAAQKIATAPRAARARPPRAVPPPSDPRGTERAAFTAALSRVAALPVGSGGDADGHPTHVGSARISAVAVALEIACYNAAVTACVAAEDAPRRQWDSPAFVDAYGARCGVVLAALDPDGPCAKFVSCASLADRLLAADPADPARPAAAALALAATVGARTAAELCPEAYADERAEIARRSAQRVEVNACTQFQCPHCRARRCTYVERQRRAADEGSDFDCTCLACGLPFRGIS
jgi:hypothetical protein